MHSMHFVIVGKFNKGFVEFLVHTKNDCKLIGSLFYFKCSNGDLPMAKFLNDEIKKYYMEEAGEELRKLANSIMELC